MYSIFRLNLVRIAAFTAMGGIFATTGMAVASNDLLREELAAMRKSQDEMLRTMKVQQEKIAQLEEKAKVSRAAPTQMPILPASTAIDSKVFTPSVTVSGKTSIKLYGFVRLDAIYDESAPNNTQVIGFVRSEDPRAAGTVGARHRNDHYTMHPRLTRLGADLTGPKISSLGGADLSGKIEIDFYNNGLLGQSESRQAVRMRHAYLKLAWPGINFSLLAGQTSDVISPLFPIVNPDLAMWGAGNLGDRRPQMRMEWAPKFGPGSFYLGSEIGLTGANDNQDLDPAGTTGAGFRDGEASGKPTLQLRAAYKLPVWRAQNLELGVWGHHAWEEPDRLPLVDGDPVPGSTEFRSYAAGMDLSVPLYKDLLWLKGETWYGANLDDVRGGIFQGINTANGKEITSRGGFVELGGRVPGIKWYSLHAGYATDDPKNNDLNPAGRTANKTWYVSNRFNFDPLEFGIDYLCWRTEYIGLERGDTNRIQFYISYKF